MLKDKNNYNQNKKFPTPFFVLAPMDDVTDTVFRQVITECAPPDLFFTEFVNVDGLQSPGRSHLLKKLQHTKTEQPLVAQIWGKNPENFYKTTQELVQMGFAGVDINMGCPVKAVVNNGCCSALMNNHDLAIDIIQATQAGANNNIPVSVKTRLGFNEIDMDWQELLLSQKLNMLTIHGRTKGQLSKVPADWDTIGLIRALRDKLSPTTMIVGNGDVVTRGQGLELAKQYKLDGIMIGRGVFSDPYVFAVKSPWDNYDRKQKIELFLRHVELFSKTWQHDERRIVTLYKFSKIYINDFKDAKELREKLMNTTKIDQLISVLKENL